MRVTVQGLSRHRRLRGIGTRPVACCLAIPAAWCWVTKLQRQQGLTTGLHPISTSQGSLQSPRRADREIFISLRPLLSNTTVAYRTWMVNGQRSVTGYQPSMHVPCGSVQLPILKLVVAGCRQPYMAVRLDDGARNRRMTQACFALQYSRDEETIDNTEHETNTRGREWSLGRDAMSDTSHIVLLSRRRLLRHPGLHPVRHQLCQAAAPAQQRRQLQLATPAPPPPAHRKMAFSGAVCGITWWELVSVWTDALVNSRATALASCVWGGSSRCQLLHHDSQDGAECTT